MAVLEVAQGASWCKLSRPLERVPTAKVPTKKGGGKRGRVKGFSRASRRRLLDVLNQIKRPAVQSALFVTLTYPGEWPKAWERWKRDIDTFGKRLRRQYPGVSFVWRLEYQRRGAPHFHLLVFGVPFIPHDWVARAWYDVVGSNDPRHLKAGTEIKRVRRFRSVIAYAAKYIGKEQSRGAARTDGRVWGIVGRDSLPIEIVAVEVPVKAWYSIRRTLRKWVEKRTGNRWITARGSMGSLSVYFPSKGVLRLLAFEVERLG